jgi:hypothetical protein
VAMPAPRRPLVVLTLLGVALLPLGAASAATLGATTAVSTPSAWTVGNGLAKTTGYLQTAFASDCPPPRYVCASDSGPFMGVFWRRDSLTAPGPWSDPQRISTAGTHAARPAIGAADTNVYVAWVTQASYLHDRPSAPRVVWVRASNDEGDSWRAPVQLSFRSSRADYPVIAASGDHAWVVWTNAGSGLIRMATTTDAGHHWAETTIGTTSSGTGSAEGYRGLPSIGASGANVAALWFATPGGRQVALTSDMGGTDWSASSTPVTLVGSSTNGWLRYPSARGAEDGQSSNVAIAYLTSTRLEVRVFDGSTLGPARVVDGQWPHTIGGHRYVGAYGPAVAPSGPHGVTIAWSACRRVAGLANACATRHAKSRIDLYERVSTDEGANWSGRVALAIATPARSIDEAPSIVADDALARTWFAWLGRTANWSAYRVYGRSAA